jgi:hypothetical protein
MSKKESDNKLTPRLASELKTIEAMVMLYCKSHHKPQAKLCPSCIDLVGYARKRLQHCPFQDNKPTCGKCTVHCYKPEMRETIRKVMRYAGPRMIYHHPVMALRHLLDGCRTPPQLPAKRVTEKQPVTLNTDPSGRSSK